jgi:hypothetical protein
MATIEISAGALGARLRADAIGAPKAVKQAIFSGAQRGRSWIVGKTPVDRGILRNAWRVLRMEDGAVLVNDQPYAGIMERGARPFKISSEGLWALKAWVMRKLQSGEMNGRSSLKTGKIIKRRKTFSLEREAEGIARAIAKNFEKVGIKGRRFVLMNLEILASLMEHEIDRYLSKFFNRPGV